MDVNSPSIIINDRYRLDAEVGRGAMGRVYRAFDLLLQREVAVKLLDISPLTSGSTAAPAGLRESPGVRTRLLNEAQSAARLTHPNIVAVYDAGEAEFAMPSDAPDELPRSAPARHAFLVMQYVEGRSLADLLAQQRRLATPRALEIARQLCAALEAAHTAGVIHRDLKPENVLISADGVARLTDFGLASWLRPGKSSRDDAEPEIVGAVFYMAPELAIGRPFDHRADLYSLGVMLYEMLAGRLPFEAAPNAPHDPIPVISQHLHATPTPPTAYNPEIPPAVEALILRLLAKDPAERPVSAAEAGAALAAAFDPAEPPPPAITPIERIARGRLVGRLPAVQESGRLWRRAASGQGSVLLVSGEPGIGKTRLVRELAARAEVSGGRSLTAVCYPQSEAPLDPILQLARALDAPGSAPETEAIFAQASEGHDPRRDQDLLFTHLAERFTAAAGSPLLLIVEDVHWADSSVIAFIRRLARLAPGLRLLLVLTYREIEVSDSKALIELLNDLNRERLASRLKLGRLNRDETGELLAVMFALEDALRSPAIDPSQRLAFGEFAGRVYEETEGNPFFIEELVKALIEDGQVVFENGRWHAADLSELRLPQSVRMAVQARVERLPEPAREALRLASVFGRKFEFDALLELSGLPEDALADALDAAERAQLIAGVEPPHASAQRPVFTFTHALIPAALHDDLGRLRRQRLHRSAGLALEKLYPQQAEKLACRLSRHFLEAGDAERAARYLAALGDQAYAVFAYQEAIEAYEQVSDFLRETERYEKAARYLMKLGLLYHLTYEFTRSQQAYAAAFDLWQRAVPPPAVAPSSHPLKILWYEPATLDPALCGDQNSIELIHQFFDGLMELTPDLSIRPNVAARWDILDGGRRYVFHLRRDRLWSDGKPVTAHDFEFSWKRMLDPDLDSPSAQSFYGVRGARAYHARLTANPETIGIHARDAWTLQVDMEEPLGYFLQVLASAALPVPRHRVQALGAAWARPDRLVGNGAFIVQEWQPGERLIIRRSPGYTGRFPGNLQSVVILTGPENGSRLDAYERGELDIISTPLDEFDRARFQHSSEMLVFPWLLTTYLGFNSTQGPLSDRRVRQALVMALDRETLVGRELNGVYAFNYGGLLPPGMPGHTPGAGLPYDPAAARRLLAEAGYPDGRGLPELEYRILDHETARRGAAFIQKIWFETLGVRIRQEIATDLTGAHRSTGLWATGWSADYPDPDSFLRGMIRTNPELAIVDREFHRLVETARTSVDQAERLRLYQAADRILVGDAYLAPLSYGLSRLLIKPWVQNYQPLPLRFLCYRDVVIDEH